MPLSLGFHGFSSKPPFDPSMMVHFRQRMAEEDRKRTNELIAERANAMVMEAVASRSEDDDPGESESDSGQQLTLGELMKPEDWTEANNWGTLSIDFITLSLPGFMHGAGQVSSGVRSGPFI
jgi:transposase, IS5 family